MRKLYLLLCFFFLSLTQTIFGQQLLTQDDSFGEHPRLLMRAGEEKNVWKNINADPDWKELHQAIMQECDHLLQVAPVERIKIGRRLLSKSREALRRLLYLSYAYRMTKESKYLQRAEKEMLAISEFVDWNPSHFLDVGEMTMALAIGYDWLYSALPDKTKQIVRTAIRTKGLDPSLDTAYNWFLTAEHNWNQVCNAGMTYGAIAVYEDDPAFSREIVNRAIKTIAHPMGEYKPDGAYPEGYGYWEYGTSFNVMFLSAVEKLFDKDFGLSSMPGFLRTAQFLENMTGPTRKPFNFSDAGGGSSLSPAMFWFASKDKDPSLLWVEKQYLRKQSKASMVKDRLLPCVLIWNQGLKVSDINAPSALMWVGRGRTPVALMRSNWTDTNAVYVAMKGGSANVNHAHMDIGSFVMDANGQRWAMDFGSQEYESLESKGLSIFGRSQNAERWAIFRYTNQAHNTLTINDEHQSVEGYAGIVRTSEDPDRMSAVVDLSDVYKNSLAKEQRGVMLVNKSYVLLQDEVQTPGNAGAVLRWSMLTPAKPRIVGNNTIELTQAGKKLYFKVEAPGQVVMKTWSTESPHFYDAPNPGTVLVGFEMVLPSKTTTTIRVSLVPENVKTIDHSGIPPLDQWGKPE